MIDRIATALSRRHLLMGLAASATAAAGVAEAASAPQENPELLALADELPSLAADYRDARERVASIVREWSPQWPVPDESLIRYGSLCRAYRSITGSGIEMPWGNSGIMRMPQIGTAEHFIKEVAEHEQEATRRMGFKSQRGVKWRLQWAEKNRALIEPARAFWAEIDRITEVSGIEPAQARLNAARDALQTKVDQVMRAEDWTFAGTIIKAQALQAWGEVEVFYRGFNTLGLDWADLLTASIMRHAQTA